MHNKEIYVKCIDGPNSTKLSKMISDALDLFMEQFVYTIVYAVSCFVTSTLLSNSPVANAVITLALYMLLLSTILFLSMKNQKKGVVSSYSAKAKAVLFQIHLLLFAVCLFMFGLLFHIAEMAAVAFTYIMLFVGFAIPLENLFSATSWENFKECVKEGYTNLGVTKTEIIVVCVIECIILILSCVISQHLWAIIPLLVIILFVLFLGGVRKERIANFLLWVTERCEGASVLIIRIGDEKVLYTKLLHKLNISNDESSQRRDKKSTFEYVLILNNSIRKDSSMDTLNAFLETIDYETIIIDPGINTKTNKKSKWFTWFSMPCRNTEGLTLEQYKSIISNV